MLIQVCFQLCLTAAGESPLRRLVFLRNYVLRRRGKAPAVIRVAAFIYYDGFARYLLYYSILLVLFSFKRQTSPQWLSPAA
jgi:hypothetical protein